MRLKAKDIAPLRDTIRKVQENLCQICDIELTGDIKACLDHDHKTGHIRGVLCQNCNGIEGKINNLANRGRRQMTKMEFLDEIMAYWSYFNVYPRTEIHPTHKTPDEKRIRRNKKAKERRLKKKQAKA